MTIENKKECLLINSIINGCICVFKSIYNPKYIDVLKHIDANNLSIESSKGRDMLRGECAASMSSLVMYDHVLRICKFSETGVGIF